MNKEQLYFFVMEVEKIASDEKKKRSLALNVLGAAGAIGVGVGASRLIHRATAGARGKSPTKAQREQAVRVAKTKIRANRAKAYKRKHGPGPYEPTPLAHGPDPFR